MGFEEKQTEKLAELEATLSANDWKWLGRNLKLAAPNLDKVDTPTLRKLFQRGAGVDDQRLIRTYLWQSWILMQLGDIEPVGGNIRSFWYQRLKPFYRRHNLLITDRLDAEPTRKKFSSRGDRIADTMGDVLAELVTHRAFKYRDLGFEAPFDVRARVGRGRPRLLLATEKEGLWSTLQLFYAGQVEVPGKSKKPTVVKFPSVSVMASNGQPSLLAMEYLEPGLKKKTKSLRIGALVDMNPYGYEIALAYTDKFTFLGFDVKTYMLPNSDWFTAEQIAAGEDYSNCPTSGEQTLANDWFEKTGGVNGQMIGVEIDVVSKVKLMMHILAWIQAMDKHDGDPPGYPVVELDDVARVRRKLRVRLPLLTVRGRQ